jgi:raffinose/stachyose/melibiose transport system permease protein
MLALDIFHTFYGSIGSEGIGQAKAVMFTIFVATVVLLQLRISRSREVEI